MNAVRVSPVSNQKREAVVTAAVIIAPETIEMRRRALPEMGPAQVLVRLEGCGVCASNLPVWEGREWFDYPFEPGAPGHEGWGIVEAVGAEVNEFKPGDRVGMLSYHAFASHDVADVSAVVRLPEGWQDVPFPAEPLGCAINAFARSDIRPEHTVAIVGIGFFGALLTQLAADSGASVIALSRREFALDLARGAGAAETVSAGDYWQAVEQIKSLTGGEGCDRVIEATGHQEPLNLAAEITRIRGRLVIAGYHQGPRQVNMQQWNWRGLDVINAHERAPEKYTAGMKAAVAAVEAGRLDPVPLITHSFALQELPQAFAMMQERPRGFLKAIVTTGHLPS